MNNIENTVIEILADHFKKRTSEINISSNLVDDLGADSIDSIEITLLIEKEFDIEVSDQQIDQITTVQSVIDLVHDLS